MRVTSGHDCVHAGCDGLAVFGRSFAGATVWACRAHQSEIGFIDRPALGHNASASAGPPASAASILPAAALSQARLL